MNKKKSATSHRYENRNAKQVLSRGVFKHFVRQDGWEFTERVNCRGVVVIVAVTEDKEILLVEQYRVPVSKRVIELPAGLAGDSTDYPHESYEEAAKRELLEETGYSADKMMPITQGPASASSAADILIFYRAYGLRQVSQGGGDSREKIKVHKIKLRKITTWLGSMQKEDLYIDPKVYTGLYWLERKTSERWITFQEHVTGSKREKV